MTSSGASADPMTSGLVRDVVTGRAVDTVRVVDGTLVKGWPGYGNEWGWTHHMIREARGTTLGVSGG